ncbi:MAG: 2-C-methyl-D-erythritol 4-phosphate cytidylyltransferase [Pyrinomonadaceae bacterium]
MNTAIIVAAGAGTRFGSEKTKQFVELNGKPMIVHTIERFEAAPSIDSILLVLAADRIGEFETLASAFGFSKLSEIVSGGATRADSVKNGLNAVDPTSEIVAVHDGARPFVSVDEIEQVVGAAKRTGAACLVGKVIDTIKSIRGGEIAATLDRSQLRRALTPQAFHIDVIKKAFENVELSDAVTDECYLVEKLGHPIVIVEGSSRNIKITQPEDILFAEALLKLS